MVSLYSLVNLRVFIALISFFNSTQRFPVHASMALIFAFEFTLITEVLNFKKQSLSRLFGLEPLPRVYIRLV